MTTHVQCPVDPIAITFPAPKLQMSAYTLVGEVLDAHVAVSPSSTRPQSSYTSHPVCAYSNTWCLDLSLASSPSSRVSAFPAVHIGLEYAGRGREPHSVPQACLLTISRLLYHSSHRNYLSKEARLCLEHHCLVRASPCLGLTLDWPQASW